MTSLLWLLPVLPLVAGGLLVAAGRRADRIAPGVAVGVAALLLADTVVVAGGRPAVSAPFLAGLPVGLAVDGLSALLVLTVAAVTLAVFGYAAAEFGAEEARARFFGLMLVFAGAMLVTVTATNLLTLLAGWEVMGATSYALIGFWWSEPRRVRAANTAFLTTRTADLGLYLTAGAALAGAGTLDLDRLSTTDRPWLHAVAAGVVLAAAGKSAQLPFSFWLSRAMEGPSPVSALLHSATMVAAGGYLMLRLSPLLAASGWAAPAVAWLGAATALGLGAVAVAQRDLKQLLAASTCAQLGYVLLAAGTAGLAGGASHLVAHAATKSLLFLGAGAWLAALGTRDLTALRGAGRRYPLTGGLFAVGALSLAGLPPLSMWVTKDELLAVARQQSTPLYAAGLAAAVLSAVYAGKALAMLLARAGPAAEAGYDTERAGTRRITPGMTVPMFGLAAGAAVLGVLGLPAVADRLAHALGAGRPPAPSLLELALSAVLAAAGVAAAAAWTRRAIVWTDAAAAPARAPAAGGLANWLGLEAAAHATVVRPTLALARRLAAFDDRVVDGGVRAAAATTRATARLVDVRLEWTIDGAVGAVAAGARRLGALARRPQTGQLHQYYAQAAVALAVLAVLAVLLG